MNILDTIKRKKGDEAEKPKAETKAVVSKSRSKDAKKSDRAARMTSATSNAHRLLLHPIVSEKAGDLAARHTYVFAVHMTANKSEVKKAVEDLFQVNVTGVRIIRTQGKVRRQGKSIGRTSDVKKAYVTVKDGESISLFEGV